MPRRPLLIVILAAGQGTRMKSALPKVLHKIAGRPMLGHVLAAAEAVRPDTISVVIGPGDGRGAHASTWAGNVRTNLRARGAQGHR